MFRGAEKNVNWHVVAQKQSDKIIVYLTMNGCFDVLRFKMPVKPWRNLNDNESINSMFKNLGILSATF